MIINENYINYILFKNICQRLFLNFFAYNTHGNFFSVGGSGGSGGGAEPSYFTIVPL